MAFRADALDALKRVTGSGHWQLIAHGITADTILNLAKELKPIFHNRTRLLNRAIQERLLDPLATKLLAGDFKPGEKIKVSVKDGALVFVKK